MEPNKVDQKVNASFEQRTIEPSAKSWEKLSERLHEKEEYKSRKYWMFGIAASFLAGILLTTLFFKGNNPVNKVPVVIQENTTPTSSEKIQPTKNIFDEQSTKEEVVTVSNETKTFSENKAEKTPTRSVKLVEERTEQVAYNTPKRMDLAEKTPAVAQFTEQLVNKTSAKILDDLQKKEAGQEVADAEINQLIHQAQLEVRTAAILSGRKNQINAQALLNNVEKDVDRSFRERVFAAVQEGVHEMKTAVANRNF